MKSSFFFRFLVSLFVVSLGAEVCHADLVEHIHVTGNEEIVKASAVFFPVANLPGDDNSTHGKSDFWSQPAKAIFQQARFLSRQAEVLSHTGNTWDISIKTLDEDRNANALVLVIATMSNGDVITEPISSLSPEQIQGKPVAGDCLAGEAIQKAQNRLESSGKSDTDTAKLRQARIDVTRKRIQDLLSDESIAQLQREELEHGLYYPSPLSRSTSAEELSFRLTALQALRSETSDSQSSQKQ